MNIKVYNTMRDNLTHLYINLTLTENRALFDLEIIPRQTALTPKFNRMAMTLIMTIFNIFILSHFLLATKRRSQEYAVEKDLSDVRPLLTSQ